MSSDVSWRIRDKLWPMPKHGSVILFSTETRRLVRTDNPGRPPRLSHSSWTMKLWRKWSSVKYSLVSRLTSVRWTVHGSGFLNPSRSAQYYCWHYMFQVSTCCDVAWEWTESSKWVRIERGFVECVLYRCVYICLLTYPNQFLFIEGWHSCVRCFFFTIIFFGVHIVCMCVRACKNATVLEIKGGIEVIFSCAKFGRYLSIYIIFMFKIFLLNSRLQIFSEVVADGTLVGC